MIMSMTGGHDDPCWDAFVTAMLAGGPAGERPSRYGGKPVLLIEGRELGVVLVALVEVGPGRGAFSRTEPPEPSS
jgi:hypothetical protein